MEKVGLDVKAAAEYLGYNKIYFYQLIKRYKIPYYRPMGKRIFFKKEDLENFVFQKQLIGEVKKHG